eukprot:TRINITY_DN4437_c0_g1_i1.p1 TRINITY_DN4437_c0_g1~~TRINITY_DN4437_c0_g1_i1.p1  ORF type:complete len:787 (-),score=198.63 TRINITY_DN4437_c0_g1_i1:34-2394(-)
MISRLISVKAILHKAKLTRLSIRNIGYSLPASSCNATHFSSRNIQRTQLFTSLSSMEQNEDKSSLNHENRLAQEKSPYLLQHKNNPVDWHPWNDEALEKAKREDKPIFLSVGYSTCHWCHVMAHESFESPAIAEIMNKYFVNIKVDREERPDIDKVYMTYVQATTGHGGWPMSVWLTPDLKPIIGGTYFPPTDKYGRPGFPTILKRIETLWRTKKQDLIEQGDDVIEQLQTATAESTNAASDAISEKVVIKCYDQISRGYDPELGGFSSAPKFPRPVIFNLLFRIVAKEGTNSERGKTALAMSEHTLRAMGEGGMFDFLGGGFHRYSVTEDWHVPHFEKMLYDQGQLVNSYLDAFQITSNPFYERRARDVMDYVLEKLTSPEGGFYSAEDADSLLAHGSKEHAEGAFYVWDKSEIEKILGEDAKVFNHHYGVLDKGNTAPEADPHGEFKGKNVLIQRHSLEDTSAKFGYQSAADCEKVLAAARKKLYEVREKRPRPHLDDKIITSWNGLMISAFARGYQVLRDERYLKAFARALDFIKKELYGKDGQLIRNYREGPSKVKGFGDDYAFLIAGLLDAYEASFNLDYLRWAVDLQEKQNELFWDAKNGGYFGVPEGDKNLVLRLREEYDGAEPSNNSVSALNLARLSHLVGNEKYRAQAEKTLNSFGAILKNSPIVMPQGAVAVDYLLSKPKQIVIVGKKEDEATQALIRESNAHFMPNKVIMLDDIGESHKFFAEKHEFMTDMTMVGGKPSAFVCEDFTCQLPVNTVESLRGILLNSKGHPKDKSSL